MAKPPPNFNDDDYSPSATLVRFDRPLSLLRGPIPASPVDDPTLGPFVLAFPTPKSFFSAFKACESNLLEQCEAGVRVGCSIAASNKCRPQWWKTLFGGSPKIDYKARFECEEREMKVCLDGSREKCVDFAREKCLGPFRSARVVCRERGLKKKEVGKLIGCVSGLGVLKGNVGLELVFGEQLGLVAEMNLGCDGGYVRGSEILGDGVGNHQS